MINTFVEVCIFQVKPDKVQDFEKLIIEMSDFQRNFLGTIDIKYMKRTHSFKDIDEIKNGESSKRLERIIKSVKYIFYWELTDSIVHGQATKELFENFGKAFNRLLIIPADKLLGEKII